MDNLRLNLDKLNRDSPLVHQPESPLKEEHAAAWRVVADVIRKRGGSHSAGRGEEEEVGGCQGVRQ